MRRHALFVAALAAIASNLAAPTAVEAETGWSPSWRDLKAFPVIALADFHGHEGERLVFDVVDVLQGPGIRTLRLIPNGVFPNNAQGRFIVLTRGKWLSNVFSVTPTGVVNSVWSGATAPHHYPRTVAGWYRALDLPVPDTGTDSASPLLPRPDPPAPTLLLVAGALGGVAMLRRLAPGARRTGR